MKIAPATGWMNSSTVQNDGSPSPSQLNIRQTPMSCTSWRTGLRYVRCIISPRELTPIYFPAPTWHKFQPPLMRLITRSAGNPVELSNIEFGAIRHQPQAPQAPPAFPTSLTRFPVSAMNSREVFRGGCAVGMVRCMLRLRWRWRWGSQATTCYRVCCLNHIA